MKLLSFFENILGTILVIILLTIIAAGNGRAAAFKRNFKKAFNL